MPRLLPSYHTSSALFFMCARLFNASFFSVLLLSLPLGAEEGGSAPRLVKEANLNALIADLGAQEAEKRDLAEAQLWQMGKEAVPFLEQAKNLEDPEISLRVERLLINIKNNVASTESSSPISVFHTTYLQAKDKEAREGLMQQIFDNEKATTKELIAAVKIRKNLSEDENNQEDPLLKRLSYLSDHEQSLLFSKLSKESELLLKKGDKKGLLDLWKDIEISPLMRSQFIHWAVLLSEDISELLATQSPENQLLAKAQIALLKKDTETFLALLPELKALPQSLSTSLLSTFYATQKDIPSYYSLLLQEIDPESAQWAKPPLKDALKHLESSVESELPEENILLYLYLYKVLESEATPEDLKTVLTKICFFLSQIKPQEMDFFQAWHNSEEEEEAPPETLYNKKSLDYSLALFGLFQKNEMKDEYLKDFFTHFCEKISFNEILAFKSVETSSTHLDFLGLTNPTPESIKAYLETLVPAFDEKKGFAQKIKFFDTPQTYNKKNISEQDKKILVTLSFLAPYLRQQGAQDLLVPTLLGYIQTVDKNPQKSFFLAHLSFFLLLAEFRDHPDTLSLVQPLLKKFITESDSIPNGFLWSLNYKLSKTSARSYDLPDPSNSSKLKSFFQTQYPSLSESEVILLLYRLAKGEYVTEKEFSQHWQLIFHALEDKTRLEQTRTALASEAAYLLVAHASLAHPKTQELLLTLLDKSPSSPFFNSHLLTQLKMAKILLESGSPELKKRHLGYLEQNKENLNPALLNTLLSALYEDLGEKDKAQKAQELASLHLGNALLVKMIKTSFLTPTASYAEKKEAFLPFFSSPLLKKNPLYGSLQSEEKNVLSREISLNDLQAYALQEESLCPSPESLETLLFLNDTYFFSLLTPPPFFSSYDKIENETTLLESENAFYRLVVKNLKNPSPQLLEEWRALKKNPLIDQAHAYHFFCYFPHLAPALLEDMEKEIPAEEKQLQTWPKNQSLKLSLAFKLFLTGKDKARAQELVTSLMEENPLHLKAFQALELFQKQPQS